MTQPPETNYKNSPNLRYSFWDGFFAAKMIGLMQDYLTPFVLYIGGSAAAVGVLSALPNFFGSIVQLKTADIVDRLKSRKKIISIFVLAQALIILPIALMAFFRLKNAPVFIFLAVIFTICGAISTPAWASMMSNLVPIDKRGEYFGWRNRALGFVTIGASFTSGLILFIFKNNYLWAGFATIFAAAFLARMVSWYFISRMREPEVVSRPENYFSFYEFLARIKESNFAKFAVFVALMSFSVNLMSPFFSVLMIRDLRFNYLLFTVITLSATTTTNLMISRWGRHADKIGNLKIIRFTAPIIASVPLLWIFNQSPLYLIGIQLLAGFAWSGFNLCSSNFIYDAVSPEKRTRCIAYFNVLNGVSLSAGALLGGFLLAKLPPINGSGIYTLCVISSLLRAAVGMLGTRRINEVRSVENISNNDLFFSIIKLRPVLGIERKTLRY